MLAALRVTAVLGMLAGVAFGAVGQASAQDGGGDLATKTANPLGGDFMLIINQFDHINLTGFLDDNNPAVSDPEINIYTVQPVISAPLNNQIGPGWSLVFRPTVQYYFDSDVPDPGSIGLGGNPIDLPGPPFAGIPFSSEDGFGDVSAFSLVGKTIPTTLGGGGAFVLAGGLAASFPWGDNTFSNDKYTLGPAAAAVYLGKPGVLGALGQQFFDIADDRSGGSAPDVNKMLLQYFYYMNVAPGWQIGASPLAILDFENDTYEVPIGMGVTYTGPVLPGLPPFKISVEAFNYLEQSDILGSDWGVKVAIIPILPSPIRTLFPSLYE
ncbi:MAG: hypothetical protein ACR2PM_13815 [Hyphomicrobiales bacterium]